MSAYATVQDIITLARELTPAEKTRAEALIPIVCAELREAAKKAGKDLDEMIFDDADLESVAKSVVVDVVVRALMTPTDEAPMSQMTQSALGYSVSGTYLVPGGGLFIKKSELQRLGIRRQRFGGIDLYGEH